MSLEAAQRRSKEIGIRKALGASVISIIRMLSREFVVLVVISNVIAWPLGYYFYSAGFRAMPTAAPSESRSLCWRGWGRY